MLFLVKYALKERCFSRMQGYLGQNSEVKHRRQNLEGQPYGVKRIFYINHFYPSVYNQFMNILFVTLSLAICITSFTPYTNWTQTGEAISVNFSPNGSLLAGCFKNRQQYIYSFTTLQVVHTFDAGDQCKSVRFSNDSKYVVWGLKNTKIILMNANASNFPFIANFTSNFTNSIQELDFSSDSNRIVVCGKGPQGRGHQIIGIPAGTCISRNYSLTDDAASCRFSPNNTYAVGDKDGKVNYYHANYTISWVYSYTWGGNGGGNAPKVSGVTFSPDGSVLATAWSTAEGKRVYIFGNLSNGTNATLVSTPSEEYKSMHYSYDGQILAAGGNSGVLRLYSVKNNYTQSFNLSGITTISQIYFSYDNCWIACTSTGSRKIFLFTGNCRKNQSQLAPLPKCPVDQFLTATLQCQSCISSMIGCRRCKNASYCSVCSNQNYLNSSNLCSPCSQINIRCIECSDATTCTKCITTYYKNGTACSLCFEAMPGCLTCHNSTYCISCAINSYYLNTTTNRCVVCSTALTHCVECSSNSTCITCEHSYFITTTNSCAKCNSNCTVCSNASTNCSECDHGYYLFGTTCPPCPQNCTLCTTAALCASCASGYFLSGSSCPKCSYQCQTCVTSATNCLSCNVGYYLNSNTCQLCNTNCASCVTTSSTCLSCNIGYYHNNASKTCVSCSLLTGSPNCLLCNSSACYQCSSGYFINGTTCYNCMTVIPGCQLCQNNTTCLVCAVKYYLSSGNCTACTWPCLSCANITKCLSCAIGYYLDTGNWTCLKCSCPTCNASNNCLSCNTDQYLSSGSCYFCTNIHSMCRSCSSSSNCLQCTPPYYLNGSTCDLCPTGCSNCTNSISCKTCTLGYYLATTACTPCPLVCSACLSNTNCTKCTNGFYLSSGSCLPCSNISVGCNFCNATACLSCSYVEGYFLNSTTCGSCNVAIPNCEVCTANNVCVQCEISYALSNSDSACAKCFILIPYCQLCSNNSMCSQCLAGYYFNGTVCSACSRGCSQCNSSTNCRKCLPQFWLNTNFSCSGCASALLGCDRCSDLNTCIQCGFGFYLSGSICTPCLSSLAGCLACNNSATCISCQNGFYLNSSAGTCGLCGSNMTGCGFCRSSGTCDICLSGYYLNTGQCSLCATPNCQTCNSTNCIQCQSGFFLSLGSCNKCVSLFTGCVMCNSSTCQSCQSGYYINGTGCSSCTKVGCSVCNNTNPNQCLSCATTYYLSSGSCVLCSSPLANCIKCTSNGLTCTLCSKGYFINGSTCALCTTPMPFCTACSTNAICDSCDSGSLLIGPSCTLCKTLIDGCMFCNSSLSCLNCQQGYFMNSSNLCSRCSIMTGCLICRNNYTCNLCTTGYFLSNGLCSACNSTMEGCIACASNSTCIACDGKYNLTVLGCTIIKSTVTYYPYKQLKLTTVYLNSQTLKHTLWVTGTNFAYTNLNLTPSSKISYVVPGGKVLPLTITGFEWGQSNRSIIFYTNNPFDLTNNASNVSNMSLFSMRLLEQKSLRQLQTSSLTNLEINADFQLTMDEAMVLTILPASLHGGNLYLDYNANQPEFVASIMVVFNYQYHYFGIIVTIYMFFFYFVKGVVLDCKGKDKGELIAHIILLKTPVLMLYPTYAELLSYCSGFMFADMPWFNNLFTSLLADPRDSSPAPYLLFYASLNIASTFLLPISFMLLCFIVLKIMARFCKNKIETLKNIGWVIYNYFLGGLSFATAACIQGAFRNPMENYFTVSSAFYLLGICLFLVLLGEAIWSSAKDSYNLFKIRTIAKSVILSILHYNALYLFAIVLVFQTFFVLMKMRMSKMHFPKLWLLSNILPNISLLMLVQFSRSLVSIYVSSGLVIISLGVQMVVVVKEYKLNRMIGEVKIHQIQFRQSKFSFMKTLDMFFEKGSGDPTFTDNQQVKNEQNINQKQDVPNVLASQQQFYAIYDVLSND